MVMEKEEVIGIVTDWETMQDLIHMAEKSNCKTVEDMIKFMKEQKE